jgi:hypothetical protein
MTANLRRRAGRVAAATIGAALTVGLAPGLATGSASASSPAAAGALTGTITDGSGHDWPLYAKVEADGKSTFTDPVTGAYTLPVAEPGTYEVTVTAQYPGYQATTQSVQVAGEGTSHDAALTVDAGSCSAPGYGLLTENFESRTLPKGWSTVDHEGSGTNAGTSPAAQAVSPSSTAGAGAPATTTAPWCPRASPPLSWTTRC